MKSFNVCIVRPENYIWSSVFAELAELLGGALSSLGHSTRIAENQIDPQARNIIIGIHLLPASANLDFPPDTIMVNTEQIGEGLESWNQNILHFVDRYPSWDYAIENIQRFRRMGIREPLHLKVGYHRILQRIVPATEYDIDVLFYGSMTPLRAHILEQLQTSGLRVVHLFGSFGKERDDHIARSKMVLNMHHHPSKIFEILRVHYLMNNAKAVVSQWDHDTKMAHEYRDGILAVPYDQLVSTCVDLASSLTKIRHWEQKALSTLMGIDAVQEMRELLSRTPHA